MYRILRTLLIIALSSLLIFASFCFFYYRYLERRICSRFEGQLWKTPSRVFAMSHSLSVRKKTTPLLISKYLKTLGYFQTECPPHPGEFCLQKTEETRQIILYRKAFLYSRGENPEGLFQLDFDDENIVKITHLRSEKSIQRLDFSPEKITEFYGTSRHERKLKKLGDVPPHVLYAIICAEDRRFLRHRGVDPKGIGRALITDLRSGRFKEGGSTITQQLVKNLFLSHGKTFIRKFNEAIMAVILENHYSKDDILEAYLNEIYLGQRGFLEIRGFGQAALHYFDKDIKNLTISEAALIAQLIPNPGKFSPLKNPDLAISRRNQVLSKMLREKTITRYELAAALNERLRFAQKRAIKILNRAPFFIDHLKFELSKNTRSGDIKDRDYSIFSTLNLTHQRAARRAIRDHLARLEHDYSWLSNTTETRPDSSRENVPGQMNIEAALLAMDPDTGYVTASVGGRNYAKSSFNRVVFGARQPGSVFKPFVFLTAFSDEPGQSRITPLVSVANTPLTLKYDNQFWSPKNYKKEFTEPVSILSILSKSINVPTVRVARLVGFSRITEMIEKLGVNPPPAPVPSIALGSIETTLTELAGAYSVLASGGFLVKPTTIIAIANSDNELIYEHQPVKKRVVSPEASYMVSSLLARVITEGTGKLAFHRGLTRGFYGKTGTTSNYHDAWFAGYTKDIVVVVWVGFDSSKNINLPGSVAALPIWIDFMKAIYSGKTLPDELDPPEGIVFRKISIDGRIVEAAFISGTEDLTPPLLE